MTLQQLAYFVSACRYANITRAAESFGISQPSISFAIKSLEREFGIALIQRQKSGFVLTEAGEEFRALAEALLCHADSVAKAMAEKGKGRKFIRLGIPPMIASVFYPSLHSGFCAEHQEIDILTQEMGKDDLLSSLDAGMLDMAFLPHNKEFSDEYCTVSLSDLETVCCVPSSHPLASEKMIHVKKLEGEPLVLFSKGFFHRERIYSLFADAGIEPRVLHSTSQLSTVERLIEEGIAIGFLFRPLAQKNPSLVPISLFPALNVKISLVFRRDLVLTDAMSAFLSYIQKWENRI